MGWIMELDLAQTLEWMNIRMTDMTQLFLYGPNNPNPDLTSNSIIRRIHIATAPRQACM